MMGSGNDTFIISFVSDVLLFYKCLVVSIHFVVK